MRALASRLPHQLQHELKRLHYRRQIRRNAFVTAEPEFAMLDRLVGEGDWAIDVGANVGHYTKRLSELVGARGRVIAVEPVPETFALLAANVSLLPFENVTLLNMAASDGMSLIGMRVPVEAGHKNYYQAAVTSGDSELTVLACAIDSLAPPHRVALVKIDAEGHDAVVIRGMQRLLVRDHPTMIVESSSAALAEQLAAMGYERTRLPGSPNTLFHVPPPEALQGPAEA